MARYRATLTTARSQPDVFDYLARFSTVRDWDPSVVDAEDLDSSIECGSRFRVTVRFLGRTSDLVYRITRYERPNLVTLEAETPLLASVDTLTFAAVDGGTRVTYDADLRPKGVLRLVDPLLQLAFNRLGDAARDGLARELGARTREVA